MHVFRSGLTAVAVAMALAAATAAAAQESINHASVSGRVTDGQGGVRARRDGDGAAARDRRHRDGRDRRGGRFRFPYLRVGAYELMVQMAGFAEAHRRIALSVGSAFEIPFVLTVEGIEAQRHGARRGAAARVGAQPDRDHGRRRRGRATCRSTAATSSTSRCWRPRVAPPNINSTQLFAETSAVPGVGLSVGSQRNFSNSFIVDGLSANDDAAGLSGMPYGVDAVEQFQVVTSGGQAELGRALGGYVNVVTRSGTNHLRGTALRVLPRRRLNAANALSGHDAADVAAAVRRQPRRADRRDRTFFFANAEQRRLDQTGLTTISAGHRRRHQRRGWPRSATRARRSPPATIENPVDTLNLLGKVDHAVSGRDQLGVRYSLYDVASANARGAGGLQRAVGIVVARQPRPGGRAVSNTLTLGARTVNETRAQFTHSDLQAPPTDPVGPGREHRRRRHVRHVRRRARRAGVNEHVPGRSTTSPSSAARTRCAPASTCVHNDDRIVFPRARPRLLHVLVAGQLPGRHLQQRRLHARPSATPTSARAAPTSGSTCRTSGAPRRRLTLNLGLRYDLQWLETHRHRRQQPVAARRLRLDAGRGPRRSWSAAAPACTSTACRCGRWPTRCCRPATPPTWRSLRQPNISLSPGQAGAPVFPAILPAPVPSVTLFNLTTMQRDLQNAYSRQASLEVERQLGSVGTVSVGYAYVARRRAADGDQPERAVVRGRRAPTTAAGRFPPTPTTAGTRRRARRPITRCWSRWPQRPARWGYYRASYTLSKARTTSASSSSAARSIPSISRRTGAAPTTTAGTCFVFSGGVNTPMTPAAHALAARSPTASS